jgi:histidine triad (HIT) family protein
VRSDLGGGALSTDCLFCRIVANEIPATVARRDERFLAFADLAPKAPVHLLVVPVRHVPSIAGVDGLDADERAAMLPFIAEVAREQGLEESGYRVTTNHGPDAHQSVPHLHWHIMGGGPLSVSM